MQSPIFVNVQIPIKWKYFVGSHITGNQKLLQNPNNPQSMDNVKFCIMEILWGKLIYSHNMGLQ